MKKVFTVIGIIFSICGFIFLLTANAAISSGSRYTWRPPYTAYESQVLLIKGAGIVLLVCGLIDLLLVIVSYIYNTKNIQDKNSIKLTAINCPNCGLAVHNTTKICPGCKTELK